MVIMISVFDKGVVFFLFDLGGLFFGVEVIDWFSWVFKGWVIRVYYYLGNCCYNVFFYFLLVEFIL